MGVLKGIKGVADDQHADLSEIPKSGGANKSVALTAGLTVTDGQKNALFSATANYWGASHVEVQLLAAMFTWTQQVLKSPFNLPNGCRVYLYCYYQPCTTCTATLKTVRSGAAHPWATKNVNKGIVWKLGYTKRYLAPMPNGHAGEAASNTALHQLAAAGWLVKPVN